MVFGRYEIHIQAFVDFINGATSRVLPASFLLVELTHKRLGATKLLVWLRLKLQFFVEWLQLPQE